LPSLEEPAQQVDGVRYVDLPVLVGVAPFELQHGHRDGRGRSATIVILQRQFFSRYHDVARPVWAHFYLIDIDAHFFEIKNPLLAMTSLRNQRTPLPIADLVDIQVESTLALGHSYFSIY